MANSWTEISLDKVAALRNGAGVKQEFFSSNGVPLVRVSDFTQDSIDMSDCKFVDSRHAQQWKSHFIAHGDVIVSTVGSWPPNWSSVVGKVIRSPQTAVGAIQNQNTCCIMPMLKYLDKKFLFYRLKLKDFAWHTANNAGGSANQARLPIKKLGSFTFSLPPLADQKTIADILGSLDDKIELNRQINTTLEKMAQNLFKSWFVDFDPVLDNALAADTPIPDALTEKAAERKALGDARKALPEDIQRLFPAGFVWTEEIGWVPEGWNIKPLDQLITLIGGGTPKTSVEDYWNGDIPWFSVVDAPNSSDVFVMDTEKHVTQAGVDNSSTKILLIGTTIISARGTVGKCAIVATPMAMNQSCYGIRGAQGISDTYVYYLICLQVADLQQRSHGSVFSTITRDTFRAIQVPFGGAELTRKLDTLIKPYFDRILSNSINISSLEKLRDTLLPKLISGELCIPDAQKLTEQVL